jgi:anti-anti-sigma factor
VSGRFNVLDVLNPPHPLGPAGDDPFTARICADRAGHVIWVSGELDLASRDLMIQTCVLSDHRLVVVEMAELTFMDCAGYGALISGRRVLEQRGGSLTLARAAGEPLRLLELIDEIET